MRFSFALFLLLPSAVTAQTSRTLPSRLIDMHFHIWEALPNSSSSKDSLRSAFNRFNLVRAVGSGPLAFVRELRATSPHIIVPGVVFTESVALPPLAAVARGARNGEIEVLGEIDAQYAGVRLDASWLAEYWALAERLQLIVAVHTGFGQPGTPYDRCCPAFRAALGNPLHLEETLTKHPRLRVYLMHAGWPFLAETKAIMQLYPHVYADLASFAFNPGIPRAEFYDYLQALLRAGLGKRLMFGSGLSPTDWAEEISKAIELINQAPFLSQDEKNDIFYGNAARFLRMDTTSAR